MAKRLLRTLYAAAIVVVAVASSTPAARAEVMFGAIAGYNRGTLQREIGEPISAYSTLGLFGYNYKSFNAHAFFQHMDLSYRVNDEAYDGIYSLSGVGVSYFRQQGKFGRAVIMAQLPLAGSYTTLTESTGTIKDQSYTYSELTTLKGGTAMQLFLGFDYLFMGSGGYRLGENFYVGLYLGYLKQSFATQATRIKTNNSVLAPPSPGVDGVDYTVTLTSANLSLSYDL